MYNSAADRSSSTELLILLVSPFSTVRKAKMDSINDAPYPIPTVAAAVCGACCMQVQEAYQGQEYQQRYDALLVQSVISVPAQPVLSRKLLLHFTLVCQRFCCVRAGSRSTAGSGTRYTHQLFLGGPAEGIFQAEEKRGRPKRRYGFSR